jgi:PPOX class probable F420-dependent enzyme
MDLSSKGCGVRVDTVRDFIDRRRGVSTPGQQRKERHSMPALSVPPTHVDLLDTNIATLATIGPDGRPQVSAVWFLADDGELKVSLNTARQKVKNLTANPAVTVFILDLANPARYLEIRGDATLEPDDEYAFADLVGAKYGGVDVRAMDGPDGHRVVVTVNPIRINAVDLSAG